MTDDDADRPDAFEWECQSCGRTQPRKNPPCSRCGGMAFEKTPITYEPREAEAGFTRRQYAKYGGAIAGVLALGGYAVYRERQLPSVSNVPGAATAASGVRFAPAESELRRRLNAERTTPLAADPDADAAATYYTRYLVKHGFHDSPSGGTVGEFVDDVWRATKLRITPDPGDEPPIDRFASGTELGEALAAKWLRSEFSAALLADTYDRCGVDVHVGPGDAIFASVLLLRADHNP